MHNENRYLLIISLISFFLITAFSSIMFFQTGSNEGAWLYGAFDEVVTVKTLDKHNPLFPSELVGEISEVESWRCSTCHGWNYKGIKSINSIEVNYPGLSGVLEMSSVEIVEWLDGSQNEKHDFSDFLTLTSVTELQVFLSDPRFEKWVTIDEISLVNEGQSDLGEVVYKKNCISCHGSMGADVNLGNSAELIFLGDLMEEDQTKLIHHLEFGSVSHPSLTGLNPDLSSVDLINIVKYLQSMPVSSYVIDELELNEMLAFDSQGDLDPLLLSAIVMFVVLILAYLIIVIRENKKN